MYMYMKTFNASYPYEGARRHRALLADAVLAELFFGGFCYRHGLKVRGCETSALRLKKILVGVKGMVAGCIG